MKLSFLTFGLLAVSASSFAYNGQIDAGFTNFDHDSDIIDSNGQVNLHGTYYFNPVAIKGPLNEAAFLGHNSNVYADYNYNYADRKDISIPAGTVSRDVTSHHFSGGIEYYVEKFYLNAGFGFGQLEIEDKLATPIGTLSNTETEDTYTYRAVAGYMPISNLLLAAGTVGYQSSNEDHDDNRLLLKAKYVAPIGTGQHFNLEANVLLGHTDDLAIAADYYFNPAFNIGAEYSIHDDSEDDTNAFAVRAKYFVNSNFAVGGAIGFGDDINVFNINASIRF